MSILALDADVVIHTPRLQVPYELFDDEICQLLRSGKNVISTAGNHYPIAHGAKRADMFTQACLDGGVSLFGVGVSPGVIGERFAMTMASTSMDLDTISISEVFEASGMVSPDFVFTVMGMGTDPSETNLLDGPLPELYRTLYSETLAYMADHLGLRRLRHRARSPLRADPGRPTRSRGPDPRGHRGGHGMAVASFGGR